MKKGESETRVMRGPEDHSEVLMWLTGFRPSQQHPITVTVAMDDESRSQKQNRLSFMWYKIRGVMTRHGFHHERAYCKLTYGAPLMAVHDKDFHQFWHNLCASLSYEQLLDAMEYVPVTRLMGVKLFAEYLNEVDRQSAAQGIVLPKPEDLYYDALMKEADRERV